MAFLPDFGAALGVLQVHLETALENDGALQLDANQEAPFVDIVRASVESDESERVGRVHLLLSGTDESAAELGADARRATVLASCRASEFAGALVSEERPKPIQETLASRLQNLIKEDYTELRDAGLYSTKTKREREGLASASDAPALHFVDISIQFVFFTG